MCVCVRVRFTKQVRNASPRPFTLLWEDSANDGADDGMPSSVCFSAPWLTFITTREGTSFAYSSDSLGSPRAACSLSFRLQDGSSRGSRHFKRSLGVLWWSASLQSLHVYSPSTVNVQRARSFSEIYLYGRRRDTSSLGQTLHFEDHKYYPPMTNVHTWIMNVHGCLSRLHLKALLNQTKKNLSWTFVMFIPLKNDI